MLPTDRWSPRSGILACLLALTGCSLLVDPQVLCVDHFALGDELAPGHYEHFDANQGTVSLSVMPGRNISQLTGEEVLVRAGDLEIGIDADDGDVFARSANGAGLDVRASGVARDWEAGDRHWIALRWSRSYELSDSQTARVALHVDSATPELEDSPGLEVGDDTAITLGDGDDAWLAVDKVVILRRPVAAAVTSEPGGLLGRWRAAQWSEQTYLDEGPWDVLFASFADGDAATCDGDRRAWYFPRGELMGELSYLGPTAQDSPAFSATADVRPLSESEAIFPGFGYYVPSSEELVIEVDVRDIPSVVVTALVTTEGYSLPFLDLSSDAGSLGADYESLDADGPLRPHVLTVSRQLPAGSETVWIRVASDPSETTGSYIHWVDIHYNLLDNPGFETDDLDADDPSWRTGGDDGDFRVEGDGEAGNNALTIEVPRRDASPSTASQNLESVAEDGNVYVAGASFQWNEQILAGEETGDPAISISNADFWAIHSDYDDGSKMGVGFGAYQADTWRRIAVVGKKQRDSTRNAHNSIVNFGNPDDGGSKSSSSMRIDNTYMVQMPIIYPVSD